MHNGLMGVNRLISATNHYPVVESILNDSGAGQLGFDCWETQRGRRKEFVSSLKTLLYIILKSKVRQKRDNYLLLNIQGVPGGMDKTSRECSLC